MGSSSASQKSSCTVILASRAGRMDVGVSQFEKLLLSAATRFAFSVEHNHAETRVSSPVADHLSVADVELIEPVAIVDIPGDERDRRGPAVG
jgi:hypothetical protein